MENNEIPESEKKSLDEAIKSMGKFFDGLSPIMDQIEKNKNHVTDLLKKENPNRAKILNYHLVLEYLIDRVLVASIPDYNPTKLKLSFYNKVHLLPTTKKYYRFFLPGIIQINTIRNKFAHNLKADITENDVKKMRPFVEKFYALSYSKKKDFNPMDVIEEFATGSCMIFIFFTPETKKEYSEFVTSYPGLEELIEKFSEGHGIKSMFETGNSD